MFFEVFAKFSGIIEISVCEMKKQIAIGVGKKPLKMFGKILPIQGLIANNCFNDSQSCGIFLYYQIPLAWISLSSKAPFRLIRHRAPIKLETRS